MGHQFLQKMQQKQIIKTKFDWDWMK